MKITGIDCHVLVIPEYDTEACSSAQDDLVVVIHTDEGITGIGETDTNPWVARECIRAKGTHCMGLGLEEMLLGEDPLQPEAIWHKLYSGSKMTGRRGAVICAMGAIDMALWDLRGKAMRQPVYKLLGGAVKDYITPYASLLPEGHTVDEYSSSLVAKACKAKAFGFKAGKMEVCVTGPYAHNAVQGTDDDIVRIVADCREALGDDFVMMVDVAYCWSNAKEALRVLKRIEQYDPFFLETPLNIDDLDGYRFLHEHSPIRIAAGEWQNTHWEFLDLADRGKLDVLQPDVGRVGGFTEAKRVCQIAEDRGRLIVPHCWKSGIGIAASAHLCAATAVCPFIEFLPAELSESVLRGELVAQELTMEDGKIALPQKPGLGIELNMDAVRRYTAGSHASARPKLVAAS
ncbi:MAG TPA: mandelate racemase/muconate lactonizing enzyme family protein [Tepidisphaeraceae bacterium]|jgi:L-alanine-DL-glutamate epimerase-like enolase superfamily enzyme|nr:mandelate racemase/muconate lactonizing enzyme family protein [Tepidisphaeraceae bacterium]